VLNKDLKTKASTQSPAVEIESVASRRTALKLALGAGYAVAVSPSMAQSVVTTSDEGLTTGTEIYDVAGSTVPFYYAMPYGKTDVPVLLMVHDIFGLGDHIKDVARRFAKAGYLVVVPDLYARQGDASKYTDIAQLMADIVSKVPDEQLMDDLDGAVQWAGDNGGDLAKVGITGFCSGGRVTWLYAEYSNKIKAAVSWYGLLVGNKSELTPNHPLDLAAKLKAPVLGLYGDQDKIVTMGAFQQMKTALADAGAKGNAAAKASEFVLYPNANHAFYNDRRPTYQKEAADDGFKRALAWFKAKGVV
jgi:carboxymethylenebutenolidase